VVTAPLPALSIGSIAIVMPSLLQRWRALRSSMEEGRRIRSYSQRARCLGSPDHWGRGVGSALFADAIAELTARQLTHVMLWVLEGNTRALQFYQGSGFVLDGARKIEDGYPQLRLRRER
jgi:GNAT superfamily N-acetyltransferase